jgi:hypothetical protein
MKHALIVGIFVVVLFAAPALEAAEGEQHLADFLAVKHQEISAGTEELAALLKKYDIQADYNSVMVMTSLVSDMDMCRWAYDIYHASAFIASQDEERYVAFLKSKLSTMVLIISRLENNNTKIRGLLASYQHEDIKRVLQGEIDSVAGLITKLKDYGTWIANLKTSGE